ncbi:MAG: cytochrome c [Paenibacillaceae bacterium]|jgi:cytochrome c551|nr:cytochrome c [Paenibacillaceae bacterium]
MNRAARIAVCALFALALGACGNGTGGNTANQGAGNNPGSTGNAGGTTGNNGTSSNVTEGVTVDAQALYTKNCVTCHGNQMEGKVGPNLQKVGSKLSMDQIAAKIQNGGGGMPAFKGQLKDTEINGLAAWLETKK